MFLTFSILYCSAYKKNAKWAHISITALPAVWFYQIKKGNKSNKCKIEDTAHKTSGLVHTGTYNLKFLLFFPGQGSLGAAYSCPWTWMALWMYIPRKYTSTCVHPCMTNVCPQCPVHGCMRVLMYAPNADFLCLRNVSICEIQYMPQMQPLFVKYVCMLCTLITYSCTPPFVSMGGCMEHLSFPGM